MCFDLFEASELVDPEKGASIRDSKQIRHFDETEHSDPVENNLVFTAPPSTKGVSIEVYEQCVIGNCTCSHRIGNSDSQLKPCRFAALLFSPGHEVSDDEMLMFNGIVDGFSIVSTEVASYDNFNYLSILSKES